MAFILPKLRRPLPEEVADVDGQALPDKRNDENERGMINMSAYEIKHIDNQSSSAAPANYASAFAVHIGSKDFATGSSGKACKISW